MQSGAKLINAIPLRKLLQDAQAGKKKLKRLLGHTCVQEATEKKTRATPHVQIASESSYLGLDYPGSSTYLGPVVI